MNKIKKILKLILMEINEINANIKYGYYEKSNSEFNFSFDKNIVFDKIEFIDINDSNEFKYVGAINYNNFVYFIPNGANNFLKLNIDNYEYKIVDFEIKKDNFLWTGGCLYKNKIYCFPRKSNNLLCINPENDKVELIDLNIMYNREHHYGGVLTKNGIIYQPPRKNNTILKIDLNTMKCCEIKISPKYLKYNYVSGKLHTNGLIYFLPERSEKIMILNPHNDKIKFLGNRLDSMVFDVALVNNNLYGFSGYNNGILNIDIDKNKTMMILEKNVNPGSYGSKLALNGKIYNVPGKGNKMLEFDPSTKQIKIIYDFKDDKGLKCAGGCLAQDGNIYCAPADGSKIIVIKFKNKSNCDIDVNEFPFYDNY